MAVSAPRSESMKKTLLELSFLAEEAVLDGQIVRIGTSEGTIRPCGRNEKPIGVCLRSVPQSFIDAYEEGRLAKDDITVPVAIIGIASVLAGGEIGMNSWVRSNPDGRIEEVILFAFTETLGICLRSTTADGESTHVQIQRHPIGHLP